MFHYIKSKIVTVLLLVSMSASLASAAEKTHNLTDVQLHAFLGIITNFILSDNPKKVLHFSSSATVTVAENQLSALTVAVNGAEGTVTYSLSDGDSGLFSLNGSTGVIVFNTAPDFETRDTYTFTVTATDSAGNVSTQDVTITISDVAEGQALKKTGQTKSYDKDGNEVTDGSIKDDGYYQAGVAPSYTRDDATEIVTDHITGLVWADDAAVATVKKPWLTQTNYDICAGWSEETQDTSKCTDTSGDTATTYCNTLTLGGFSDWRLPNIDELVYIADNRIKRYPDTDTTFEYAVSSAYSFWSSSTIVGYEHVAWHSNYRYDGNFWCSKSYSHRVRCVRVGQ